MKRPRGGKQTFSFSPLRFMEMDSCLSKVIFIRPVLGQLSPPGQTQMYKNSSNLLRSSPTHLCADYFHVICAFAMAEGSTCA